MEIDIIEKTPANGLDGALGQPTIGIKLTYQDKQIGMWTCKTKNKTHSLIFLLGVLVGWLKERENYGKKEEKELHKINLEYHKEYCDMVKLIRNEE